MDTDRTILERLYASNPYDLPQEVAEQIQFQKQIDEYGN